MNIERLKGMLADAKSRGGGGNDLIWKPSPGLNTIRAIPYIHDLDMPFIELLIHYKEVSKTPIMSPATPIIGKPDPILEFGLKLQEEADGDKETWVRGAKLQPKSRYFLPILVRGKEREGVKFWGFGVQIFQTLYAKITNPRWGDFTDPMAGRDIDITYNKPTKTDQYGSVLVDLSPEKTPVTEDPTVLELMKDMPRGESLYRLHSFEELNGILRAYIERGGQSMGSTRGQSNARTGGTDYERQSPPSSNDSSVGREEPPATHESTTSPTDASKVTPEMDLKEAFNDIFKKAQGNG